MRPALLLVKIQKLSLPYQLLLLLLSLPQSQSQLASLRGRCLCRSWLAVLLLLLLRADFEWGRLRLNSTRRNANATRRERRGEATRCHEKHLDGFRSASVCWQISDASAAKIRPKTRKENSKIKYSFQIKHTVKETCNKRQNVY